MRVPTTAPGSLAVAASAERQLGDNVEQFFWLIKVTKDEATAAISLSNDNFTGSRVRESLVHTMKCMIGFGQDFRAQCVLPPLLNRN
jgi:hypothetical protein